MKEQLAKIRAKHWPLLKVPKLLLNWMLCAFSIWAKKVS